MKHLETHGNTDDANPITEAHTHNWAIWKSMVIDDSPDTSPGW